jgi:hypothetical protein
MTFVTLVKKIKSDGALCAKCADVLHRLERDGLMPAIDRVAIADERDPQSEGMVLARQHGVSRAPFFIVEDATRRTQVYTVYFAFIKEVLQKRVDNRAALAELIDQNPDLNFI